jgi:hypothetical protein
MPIYKEKAIPVVENLIQYRFTNSNLCWEAIHAKGACGFVHGNKRLALVGDAVLQAKLIQDWYSTGDHW